jgi:hypothetical protein
VGGFLSFSFRQTHLKKKKKKKKTLEKNCVSELNDLIPVRTCYKCTKKHGKLGATFSSYSDYKHEQQ